MVIFGGNNSQDSIRDHENADLIAITQQIDVEQWPPDSHGTLVVDLEPAGNDVDQIRELGYRVFDSADLRLGMLLRAFEKWTAQQPSLEVMTDAIEEYLAV